MPREIKVGMGKFETEVTPAAYDDNWAGHFRITDNDVKKLTTRENPFMMKNGKFDEALYEKLINDLGRLDNDPQWAGSFEPYTPKAGDDVGAGVTVGEDGMLYGENGVSIFAKGGDNLAAGMATGIEQDENGNYTLNPEKFILGLGGYTAAKALIKHPKVQQGIKDEIGKQLQRYEEGRYSPYQKLYVGAKDTDIGAFSDTATKKVMGEIDDSNIKYNPIPKQKVEFDGREYEQNYAKLGEIIDHQELFKQYPELKDMLVSIGNNYGKGGSYNQAINAIALDGGNVNQIEDDVIIALRNKMRELDKNPIDNHYAKLYKKLRDDKTNPDDLQAIDNAINKTPTAKRMAELETELYKALDNANESGARSLNNDGKSTIIHEIQHSIQKKEGWARGGSLESKVVLDKALTEIYAEYKHLPYVQNLVSGIRSGKLSHQEYKNKILDIANSTKDKGLKGYLFDVYQALHGEQQARAAAYRKDMTPAQRQSESMWDTLKNNEGEVPESIVHYGDGLSESISSFDDIKKFIKESLHSKSNVLNEIKISKPKDSFIAFVKDTFGFDLTGYTRYLDNYSVKHIIGQHGNKDVEASRGQISLTDDDISLYDDITSNFEKIAYGGKTKQGRDTIAYMKQYGDKIYIIEEIRTKKNKLIPMTMWKMKATTPDASGYEWKPAPRSNAQVVSPHKEIIPQKDENIKANGGNSLGGALGGGLVGGMEDTNGDGIPDNFNFEKAIIGAAGGAYLGKKYGGQGTGLFAGKSATGYNKAATAGKAFEGKYDGLSRFEIDDSKAMFVPKAFHETKTPNLESVLYHPDLYKQYPELKNIPVHIDPDMKASGSFDGEIIKISPRLEEDEVASTMLHEIQHWIQGKEG